MDTLDERILLLWLAAAIVVAMAAGLAVGIADALYVGVGTWTGPATFVAATFLGFLYAAVCYRTFRFECDRDVLYLQRGVFTRVQTAVPVVYVRRVDVRRSPFERAVGLHRIMVYSVGSRRTTVAVPGLSADRATTLQERLGGGRQRRRITSDPDEATAQYGSSMTSDPASS